MSAMTAAFILIALWLVLSIGAVTVLVWRAGQCRCGCDALTEWEDEWLR